MPWKRFQQGVEQTLQLPVIWEVMMYLNVTCMDVSQVIIEHITVTS